MENKEHTGLNHQKCYFYCPECGYEEILNGHPKGSATNLRGGYGRPLYQSNCPKCHAISAGSMYFEGDDLSENDKLDIRNIVCLQADARTIYIELEDGENGYGEVHKYVEKYWQHNVGEDTIVALALSHDGEDWYYCNEIVSPYDYSGAEWLNDWWEGEKYIQIFGIKSVSEIDITGGLYDE